MSESIQHHVESLTIAEAIALLSKKAKRNFHHYIGIVMGLLVESLKRLFERELGKPCTFYTTTESLWGTPFIAITMGLPDDILDDEGGVPLGEIIEEVLDKVEGAISIDARFPGGKQIKLKRDVAQVARERLRALLSEAKAIATFVDLGTQGGS